MADFKLFGDFKLVPSMNMNPWQWVGVFIAVLGLMIIAMLVWNIIQSGGN